RNNMSGSHALCSGEWIRMRCKVCDPEGGNSGETPVSQFQALYDPIRSWFVCSLDDMDLPPVWQVDPIISIVRVPILAFALIERVELIFYPFSFRSRRRTRC
ncbi:MAG: hypothetical protein AAGA30_20630, partial [Planctomycetota bacterium]